MADPWSAQVALPDAVEQLLQNICREQKQAPPGAEVRQKLASLGEEAALEILRQISASFNRKGLGGFILYMIDKASPQRLAPVFPLRTPSFASRLMFSPPQGNLRGSPSSSLSSEKLAAWGELEFRKAFLILSYIGENQLEDIDDISADEIRSLKHLRMLDFEESVWESLGKKYIDKEDRLMVNVCHKYFDRRKGMVRRKKNKKALSWGK